MTLPDPLTPPDLDLRDFDWMPLDVARLRDSDLSVLAPGDAFRAAVLLWCASWHQAPAASLPMDERLLANLAGYGRDLKGWTSVRADALRGFIECSDGRLYHPVVAEKAIEADVQRKKQRSRTAAATSARRGVNGNVQRDEHRDVERNDASDETRNDVHLTLPNPTIPLRGREPAPAKASRSVPKESAGSKLDLEFSASDATMETIRAMGFGDLQFNKEYSRFVPYYMGRGTLASDWDAMLITWFQRATAEPAPKASPPVNSKKFHVKVDTEAWRAWSEYLGKTVPTDKNFGWYFDSEWPPGFEKTKESVA